MNTIFFHGVQYTSNVKYIYQLSDFFLHIRFPLGTDGIRLDFHYSKLRVNEFNGT